MDQPAHPTGSFVRDRVDDEA